MEATRVRFESLIEWGVAVVCIVALLAVGSLAVREFRIISALTAVSARETLPASAAPAGVPSRAVSVPMLLLPEGLEVRVGDRISAVAARLGGAAAAGRQTIERTAQGERLTRFYDQLGTHFVLVFEPFDGGAEPRVAAIYLQ